MRVVMFLLRALAVWLIVLVILFAFFPPLFVYPLVVVLVWIAVALHYRGYKLHRRKCQREKVERDTAATVKEEQG